MSSSYQAADEKATQRLASDLDEYYTRRGVKRTRQSVQLADFGAPLELLVDEASPGSNVWTAKVWRESEVFFEQEVEPKQFAKDLAGILQKAAESVRATQP